MCKKKKRILSLVLSLLMVCTMMPMPVSAAEVAEPEVKEAVAAEDTVETPEQAEEPAAETTNGLQQPAVAEDTVETPEQATEEPLAETTNGLEEPLAETTNGLEQPAVGDGTEKNPFQIATAGNLYWFATMVNEMGVDFNAVLTKDIDIDANSWTPICSDDLGYSGTFDGQGYTIRGLRANLSSTNYVGLFGFNDSGTIKNVNVVDAVFDGNMYVGGVCGANMGTITNCTASGSVNGNQYVGGVCGQNNGSITNCINSGSVSGGSLFGGVCGSNAQGASVTNCYYDNVKCTVGGINNNDEVGSAEGKDTKTFASGEVTWLLNGSYSDGIFTPGATDGSQTWYQNLATGGDAYPTLVKNTDYTVYQNFVYDDNGFRSLSGYTNTKTTALSDYQKPETGDGTETAPYEIANAGNLYWFAAKVNGTEADGKQNMDACAKLMNDITVNTNVLDENGDLNGDGSKFRTWTPIGTSTFSSFDGTFDGGEHAIKGLYVNASTKGVGLIGYNGGTIQNVNVVDSYFNNTMECTGGVCGYNTSTIENCTNRGSVIGTTYVGGVCGLNESTITNCTNSGSVSGTDHVGGVCGYNTSTIENCTNSGSVIGTVYVGGVCSYNTSTIENCTNRGSVIGTTYVGGVCGRNDKTITNCTNRGNVSGTDYVGGVCGNNSINGSITNCINSGNVSCGSYGGGVCGMNQGGAITNCINSGSVSGNTTVKGGVSGINAGGTITNCYYDNVKCTIGGIGRGAGSAVGKTTKEFASGEVTWLLNGSKSTPAAGETLAWYQNLGEGVVDAYPVLDSTHGTVYLDGTSYTNTKPVVIPTYTITVTSSVKGSDSNVTVSPIEVKENVKEGKATVIAQEKDGYKFLGWYHAIEDNPGYDSSKEALDKNLSYTFDLKSDISLVAVYEANGSVSVGISGNGFTVTYGTTTTEEQNSNYSNTLQIGTKVTLNASNAESFLYWKNENGKIMSQSANYTFTVTDKTNLTMVTKATAENTAFVEFVSAYNQVIAGGVYSATSETLALPTDIPSKVGYDFVKWGKTVEEIKTAIGAGEKHITVSPEYTVKTEKYTITQYNAQDGVNISETPVTYKDLVPGSTKTLTAEPIEGKKFKCWSSDVDGTTVLGTNESYFMQLSSNVTIYAIYVADSETVIKMPTIVMTNKYATTVNGSNKVSFVATRTVPEGYTLVEQGMLYSKEGSVTEPTDKTFIVGGENIYKYTSSDMAANGVFTMNIKTPAVDTLIYARAYMIVKNNSTGNEEIIYSGLENGRFQELGN